MTSPPRPPVTASDRESETIVARSDNPTSHFINATVSEAPGLATQNFQSNEQVLRRRGRPAPIVIHPPDPAPSSRQYQAIIIAEWKAALPVSALTSQAPVELPDAQTPLTNFLPPSPSTAACIRLVQSQGVPVIVQTYPGRHRSPQVILLSPNGGTLLASEATQNAVDLEEDATATSDVPLHNSRRSRTGSTRRRYGLPINLKLAVYKTKPTEPWQEEPLRTGDALNTHCAGLRSSHIASLSQPDPSLDTAASPSSASSLDPGLPSGPRPNGSSASTTTLMLIEARGVIGLTAIDLRGQRILQKTLESTSGWR